jgi:hypothetical protein
MTKNFQNYCVSNVWKTGSQMDVEECDVCNEAVSTEETNDKENKIS